MHLVGNFTHLSQLLLDVVDHSRIKQALFIGDAPFDVLYHKLELPLSYHESYVFHDNPSVYFVYFLKDDDDLLYHCRLSLQLSRCMSSLLSL